MIDEHLLIPPILPGETVFSWVTRFHRLTANSLPESTLNMLFGKRNLAFKHDIPTYLSYLSKVTKSLLGSPESLLLRHSAFKHHIPFLSVQLKELITDTLLISQDNSKARGMLALNKHPNLLLNQLKYCPDCVNEQKRVHYFSFWLLDQQAPGHFWCLKHNLQLRSIRINTYRGHTKQLCLPGDYSSQSIANLIQTAHCNHLRDLTLWSEFIYENNYTCDQILLRWCYLYQAQKLQLLSLDGNTRTKMIGKKFIDYYGNDFLALFGKELLGDLHDENSGFISSLVRNSAGYKHPLKHFLLINVLFRSRNEFEQVFVEVSRDFSLGGYELCNQKTKVSQVKLIARVSAGESVNRVSDELGTNNTSAIKLLNSFGVKRHKRPKVLTLDKEIRLNALLDDGADKSVIYEELNIKPSFLKSYLAKNTASKIAWLRKCHLRNIDNHRIKLLGILRSNEGINIKKLKLVPGNGYQWLLKHDKEWLRINLPALWNKSD